MSIILNNDHTMCLSNLRIEVKRYLQIAVFSPQHHNVNYYTRKYLTKKKQ